MSMLCNVDLPYHTVHAVWYRGQCPDNADFVTRALRCAILSQGLWQVKQGA